VADGSLPGAPFPEQAAHHLYASSSRIRDELGYIERVSRGAALAATIAWERDHPPGGLPISMLDYEAEDRALSAEQT
jgi:hypothetical protein